LDKCSITYQQIRQLLSIFEEDQMGMKMTTRNIILGSLGGIILVIGILMVYRQVVRPEIKKEITQITPSETAILFAFNDLPRLEALLSDSGKPGHELSQTKLYSTSILPIVLASGGQISEIQHIPEIPMQQGWLFIHQSNNKFYQTLAFNQLTRKEYKNWIKSRSDIVITQEGKNPIFSLDFQGQPIFITWLDGFLLLSAQTESFQAFLSLAGNEEPAFRDSSFQKIYSTANRNAVANFYLNHHYLDELAKSAGWTGNSFLLEEIKTGGTWTEWDLTLTDTELYLNGFTLLPDQLTEKANQSGAALLSFIPSYSLSHQIMSHRKAENISEADKETINRLSIELKNEDLPLQVERFRSLIQSTIAWVKTGHSGKSGRGEFMLLELKSQSESENFLRLFARDLQEKQGFSSSEMMKEVRVDDGSSLSLYQIPVPELAYLLGGSRFQDLKVGWAGLYQHILILAEEEQSLAIYLQEIIRRNTLSNNSNYRNFAENLSENFIIDYYLNLKKSTSYLDFIFQGKLDTAVVSSEIIDKFQAMNVQIGVSRKDGMTSNDLVIRYQPGMSDKPQTIWEVGLDSLICTKPAIISNKSTGTKEILVQDQSNKLYLISNAGRIIWEKQLESRIISKIIQISPSPKNEDGFIFNTEDQVHFIDQEGNYRNRYPIYLPKKATSGLSLIEGKKKDVSGFILGLEDRTLRVYKLDGNTNNDWKFNGSDQIVKQEVLALRLKEKNLFAFHDGELVYFTDERGKLAMDCESTAKPSANPMYWNEKPGNGRKSIVYTDVQGTLIIHELDETSTQHNFKPFSDQHRFLLADLNGDSKNDYIFADERELSVYDHQFKELFQLKFDSPISEMPVIYQFPGGVNRVGVVCSGSQKIYLINSDGSFHPGFPLKGVSSFSISSLLKNGNFTLLVGSSDGFLYQYEVK
jgi:hypothetical protein